MFVGQDESEGPAWNGLIVDRADLDSTLLGAAMAAGVHYESRWVTHPDWDPLLPVIVATGRRLPVFLPRSSPPWTRGVAHWAWSEGRGPLCGELVVDRTNDGWWYAMGDQDGTVLAYCTWNKCLDDRQWQAAVLDAGWLSARWGELRPHRRPASTGGGLLPTWNAIPAGDAALSVDPLTGRGLTFAVESATRAVEASTLGEAGLASYAAWLSASSEAYLRERELFFPAGEGVTRRIGAQVFRG